MHDFVPTTNAPLDVSDPELIRYVSEHMTALGFQQNMRVARDKSLLELDSGGEFNEMVDNATPPKSPVACLVRCFVFDAPTAESTLREHLGNELVDVCFRLGLFERRGELVVGAICISPRGDESNFFDYARPAERPEMEQFVMGAGLSTRNLIGSIPKRRFERVLDLCSGSGAAAFSAAPRATAVVAADYNDRALNLARFTAAWNGLHNVDVRFTDRFSGVAGDTFDMIVCNPPFVVKPPDGILFLSGGIAGDGFSEQILRGIPSILTQGGFAHILCDVTASAHQSSVERLREWVAGNGCDALFLARPPIDPRDYAEEWLSPIAKFDLNIYRDKRMRWIQYYRDSGFSGFQRFLVVFRRRTTCETGPPNWIHVADMPNVQENYGHHILRLFANEDMLRAGEDALLACRPKLAPDVALDVRFRPNGQSWAPDGSNLRLTGGMDYELQVSNLLGLAAANFDGTITVAEFVDSLAPPNANDDSQSIRSAIVEAVTHVFRFGLLAPAECFETEGSA